MMRRPVRVTVVVPTHESAATLAPCLESIHSQTHPDVEIIVVDNHSTDLTPHIAFVGADLTVTAGPERSAQRNLGAAVGTGSVLLFVDSDMVLHPDVAGQVAARFAADAAVGALVVPERALGSGYWAACRSLEKDLYLGNPRVEAARAFRLAAFEAVGGYDERLTGFEDWDLPDRVAAAGWRIDRIQAPIWHNEGRIALRHCFAKKRHYARGSRAYLAQRRRRPLTRGRLWSRALRRSPWRAAGLAVLKAIEAAGFTRGLLDKPLPHRS